MYNVINIQEALKKLKIKTKKDFNNHT